MTALIDSQPLVCTSCGRYSMGTNSLTLWGEQWLCKPCFLWEKERQAIKLERIRLANERPLF